MARVRVELAPLLTLVGLKEAVAPLGRPLALKLTVWEAPLVVAVEMVLVVLLPCATLTMAGLALMEKSGGWGLTVSETVVLWVAEGPAPVTVTLTVPVGVDEVVAIVMVELPPVVTLVGLKLAVAPLGKPLALKLTVCEEPVVSAVEMVLVPLAPWVTVTVVGLALMEKSPGPWVTVSDTLVEWVVEVPVPVTVTV